MAEVRAIKRGKKWQYIFEIAKVGGKRQRISKSGFDTKGAALEAGTKAKADYDNAGIVVKENDISLHDYLEIWLEQYCDVNLNPQTVHGYRKKIRLYIDPELGKYRITSLTPIILQDFINDKFNEGFSRNTLSSIKGILNKSLKHAVSKYQFLKSNPMKEVELPMATAKAKVPTRKKVRVPVTKEQFEKIIDRFPEGTSQHIPLILGYKCGLRLGEVFALDIMKDFDEESKVIFINHQVQHNDTKNFWYLSNPKYDSKRTIDLDDETFNLLLRKKKQMLKDMDYYGDMYTRLYLTKDLEITDEYDELNPDNYIEFNPLNRYQDGRYIQPRIMQHCGRIVHYQLDLPDWDFHSLRHTHASILLAAGADIKYVQDRLGHKNIETTLNVYSHVMEEMRTNNVEILNGCF